MEIPAYLPTLYLSTCNLTRCSRLVVYLAAVAVICNALLSAACLHCCCIIILPARSQRRFFVTCYLNIEVQLTRMCIDIWKCSFLQCSSKDFLSRMLDHELPWMRNLYLFCARVCFSSTIVPWHSVCVCVESKVRECINTGSLSICGNSHVLYSHRIQQIYRLNITLNFAIGDSTTTTVVITVSPCVCLMQVCYPQVVFVCWAH